MPAARPHLGRVPLAVLLVAFAAALLHLAPLWRAQATVEPGWEFTGNLATSPDAMQYRVWQRRSEFTGPLTDNRFTTEPHQPYLPVGLYWFVGALARGLGVAPEFVYEWLGAPLAAALVLLVFLCARRFLAATTAQWWVFFATLCGGGLGAHQILAAEHKLFGAQLTEWLSARLTSAPVWDQYRSHYVCKVLFDTHFLVAWVFTVAAVLAFRAALAKPSALRLGALALSSTAVTLLHPYEGPLLLLIHAVTWALVRWRGVAAPGMRPALLAGSGATALMLAAIFALQQRAGLPLPEWRPVPVSWINVLLAYPLVALVAPFGLRALWRRATLDELFLLGWAGGCLAMTLSSAIYPYAARGPTTAQIPLFLLTGAMYFAARSSVPWKHALLALVLLGVSAPRDVLFRMRAATFDRKRPAMFRSDEQRAVVAALVAAADANAVLLAQAREYRWLAPEFPGLSYHAHFFLTVEFERKRAEVDAFYASGDLDEQARLLDAWGIDFLHAPRSAAPERFARLPGWRELARADGGVLFQREVRGG